jgi:spore germination protein YaaH
VYDHARLVEIVDRVRIMAYDFSTATPGPIAPLDWVGEVVDSAVAVTGRPDRLVLGIPLYGYNWPGGTRGDCPEDLEGRTGVTARSIDELLTRRNAAPVWNETTGEWAAVYDLTVGSGDCIQARRVHWVDATGAALRIDLARRAGLDGVALWALGYDDDRQTHSTSVVATYAWSRFMGAITKGMPVQPFPAKPTLESSWKGGRKGNKGSSGPALPWSRPAAEAPPPSASPSDASPRDSSR